MAADDDQSAFDEFADEAADANFGRQDHLAQAAEARQRAAAEKEGGLAKAVKAMREQKATWQTDGLGVKGHIQQVSNATANLIWPTSGVTRRASPEVDQGDTQVVAEVVEE